MQNDDALMSENDESQLQKKKSSSCKQEYVMFVVIHYSIWWLSLERLL